MINDFDLLLQKCKARAFRRIVRILLRTIGSIALAVIAILGYRQWSDSIADNQNIQKSSMNKQMPIPQPTSGPQNLDLKLSVSLHKSDVHPSITPQQKNSERNEGRRYVLQLMSSKSLDDITIILQKIPEKYQSGMAIYHINNYYALRYIDIFDSKSLPTLIEDFKKNGFQTPVSFKYDPRRIPITQTNTPSSITLKTPVHNNQILEVSNETTHPLTPNETYQKAPKYETAMGIARDFYTKENYSEAAMWAKKANQINREAEEAWLLYAKSYYAQGKKNEATSVLELYLNYKNSKAAAELLKTWR